jgi:hypothetical protein
MRNRRFAVAASALLFAAFAPAAMATTGVGTAPGDEGPATSATTT